MKYQEPQKLQVVNLPLATYVDFSFVPVHWSQYITSGRHSDLHFVESCGGLARNPLLFSYHCFQPKIIQLKTLNSEEANSNKKLFRMQALM